MVAAEPRPTPKPDPEPAVMAPQPAVVAEAELPRPILASYTPEALPALAAVNMPIKHPSPVPAHKPFIYASLGGPLPAPKPEIDDASARLPAL